MSKTTKAISVIAALFILVSAFASPALAGKNDTTATSLVFLPYESNGSNLWFQVDGKVTNIGNSFFNGTKVGCRYFSDTNKVRCTLPKNTSQTTGLMIVGNLSVWVEVPAVRPKSEPETCEECSGNLIDLGNLIGLPEGIFPASDS
jgi:hypothetical protein